MSKNTTTRRVAKASAWFAAGALGATALTGVAMANVPAAEGDSDSSTQTRLGRGGPGGPGGPGGHHKGPGGPMLHSQGVIEKEDGVYVNVATQKGEVSDVSDSGITVTSEDGFSERYAINEDTKIHKDREEATAGDISVGDSVHIMAEETGDGLVAKRIGVLSPEAKAEMEQKREERRQQFQERLQERLNKGGEDSDQAFSPNAGSVFTL